MITDADIKKMKEVFVTKEDAKSFSTKEELRSIDLKMNKGFMEIIEFIGEVKTDILNVMNKHLEELKEITRRHQMTLKNHDSRISHLEYLLN